MASDKEALRIWQGRIRDIINHEWDPIGRCPEDEYDRYVRTISAMIRDDRDDFALMQYLERTDRHESGLGRFDAERARRVVAAIRKLGPAPV
jgi:hypothetical protein